MNSSSSFGFGGDFSSGFSKSTSSNPGFNFSAPSSTQRPSGGLPRPKPGKSKKQSNSHNSKSSGKSETRTGPDFNLLRPASLSYGGDLGGSLFSKLPNDETKLNIDNYCLKGDRSNNDDGNVGSFIGRGVETEKLQFEFQSKSNTTGNDVDDGAKKDFVFNAGEGNLPRSVSDTVCDGIKNMNIKGCESSDHLDRKIDKALSAGMEMSLKIGSIMGDSTGQTDRGFTFQAATAKAHMDYPKTNTIPGGASVSTTLFSSSTLPFQASLNSSGMASDKPGKKEEFCFTAKQDAIETPPFVEFKTPNSQTNIAFGFGAEKESGTSTKVKKKKGKSKQPKPVQLWHEPDFVPSKTSGHCLREHSLTSNESFSLDNKDEFSDSQSAVSHNETDGELVATAQYLNIKPGRLKDVLKKEGSGDVFDGVAAEAALEDSGHGSKTENFAIAAEDIDALSSAETEVSSRTSIDRQDSDVQMYFSSPSNYEQISGFEFTFAASPSGKSQHSSQNRHHKKKNSAKSASLHLSPGQYLKADVSIMQSKIGGHSGVDKGSETKSESNLSSSSTAAVESCEKWRLRGNQAYASGDSSKAEEYYMQGISCIPAGEKSRSCLRALMLCYSNLAATRMSLGRMRDALGDCMMAISLDPNFLRVQLRAANCYLALGEVENAISYFRNCLQSGTDVCVDRKVAVEASDGLQKAQKLSECMQQSALLLQSKTSDDAEAALEVIAEALQISLYSDQLLEMKAEAFVILGKYEDVVQLCDQTSDSAEKNSPSLDANGQLANPDSSGFSKDPTFRIWRCHLIFKSYFHLGKLEEAIAFLEKQEDLHSTKNRDGSNSLESSIPLAATVRELLTHKAAGNEAFQSGRHFEAVDHYTTALSCNVESRPFAAICFCNRAAAYKAQVHITDAIADCSLAIALDGNYWKAISRRASLYEKIRDYEEATSDVERLLSLLMHQMETKNNQTGLSERSVNVANDLRHARSWLSEIEEENKKEVPLDFYLILGVEPSVSTADIKKAYRKAALRHHPDKAIQSLVRIEHGDDKLWKEIKEEAYKDADKLFKIIGEAYAVLSDPIKRSKYDSEEQTRNLQKKHVAHASRAAADGFSPSFDKSSGMRSGKEARRESGYSASKGSKATRPNRFF